jgi:3-hydroxyacyl-[acyl-carrier-protein] dehydratase
MRWFWIDKFLEFESGRRAKAVKCVSLAEDYLHDHLPQHPIFPNSLVIEGMAQTGGLLFCEYNQFTEKVILAKVPKVQFYCTARPGDTLTYSASIEYHNAEGAAVSATSHIGERLQAEAEIVFAHLNEPWLGTYFSPDAFLSMMRVFGAYRVGRAADGSPLRPPARFCRTDDAACNRQPATNDRAAGLGRNSIELPPREIVGARRVAATGGRQP